MTDALERFAAGRPVRWERAGTVLVGLPAQIADTDRLERLVQLARGPVRLGVGPELAAELRVADLPGPAAVPGRPGPSVDAVHGRLDAHRPGGMAYTMRVAAETGAAGLVTPGHVVTVALDADDAGLRLADRTGQRAALALAVVLDGDGRPLRAADVRHDPDLRRLPAWSPPVPQLELAA